ncbi:hypothetical protein EV424DRAFT_804401 [Suillus variegatus]|nr:hypothetical protein EV424DRAFT_804401 [Suillus variegatus]
MLVNQIQQTLDKTSLKGLSNEAIKELARKNAEAELQNICIRPLGKFAGSNIPHAAISTNEDYKKTLTHLIQITENCVSQHSASEAAVITSIRVAQRVDPGLKIKASFKIAKKNTGRRSHVVAQYSRSTRCGIFYICFILTSSMCGTSMTFTIA